MGTNRRAKEERPSSISSRLRKAHQIMVNRAGKETKPTMEPVFSLQ
jgi:hypothetical protein